MRSHPLRRFLSFCAVFFAFVAAAHAQRLLPSAPLLPSSNPLCDSHITGCLDIDDFAGHGYVHLMVLPKTESRETAVMFPFGVSLGLFGRVHAGASTSYTFWQDPDGAQRQFGPIRLNLSALVWPLFPLSQAPRMTLADDGASHFQPRKELRIGAEFEQQLRVGPFDGANSLGLMRDLAMLRVIAVKGFGSLEITASGGALFEWQGGWATGIAGVELGLYLPFFKAMKLFGEAQARGFGTQTDSRSDNPSPIASQLAPLIQTQAVVGFGASFRPSERVDFGIEIQRGFRGLADWAVLLRFAVLSVGRTYQGRAATPVVQLTADIGAEALHRVQRFLQAQGIDPILDEQCVIRDDDHSILGTFGKLTANKNFCELDGFKVPIHFTLFRPRKSRDLLCLDGKLTDCLLILRDGKWQPIHEPRLDHTCTMHDSDGTIMGQLGQPTPDGKHCRYVGERQNGGYGTVKSDNEVPIGRHLYADDGLTKICRDRLLLHCLLVAKHPGERIKWDTKNYMHQAALQAGEQWLDEKKQDAQHIAHTVDEVVSRRVGIGTIAQHIAQRAQEKCAEFLEAASTTVGLILTQPGYLDSCISDAIDGWNRDLNVWNHKLPEEQAADSTRAAVRIGIDGATSIVGGAIVNRAGTAIGTVRNIDKFADKATPDHLPKLPKTAHSTVSVAEHVDEPAAHRLLKQLKEKEAKDAAEKAAKEAAEKAEQRARWRAEEEAGERAQREAPPHDAPPKERHGNFVDDRPATLYEKYDGHGNFQKHGVTKHENPRKRYTDEQVGNGFVIRVDRGPRREMMKKERELVESSPGPDNHEPWAGKRRQPSKEMP